jgi:hypothetical protein
LDGIERAIRNAFEKGDADDRAFRERVYRSAFAALDRALQGNPNVPPEVAEKRRSDLQAKIAEIETEFIPAVPDVDTPAPGAPGAPAADDGGVPSVELDVGAPAPVVPRAEPAAPRIEPAVPPRPGPDTRPAVDPVFDIRPGQAQRADPVIAAPEPPAAAPAKVEPRLAGDPEVDVSDAGRPVPEAFFPDTTDFGPIGAPVAGPQDAAAGLSAADGPNVRPERRRPLAAAFFGVTLLALAGIGIWWALSTGLIRLPGAPDTDGITVVPPDEDFTPGEEEAPQKPGEADARRDWIAVFAPDDPTTVSAPSDTKADVMSDDSGSFVRIRSGASGSTVVFDVAKGALEQIAGKHATFDIVARGAEDKETQFSVDCNFGELGDCGRKRYHAGFEKGDFLFDIDLPAKAPGAEGTIAIDSDVDNGGKALDIYEIRVSIVE